MQTRAGSNRRLLWGAALAVLSAMCYGASQVIAKKGMKDYDVPPILFTSMGLFFGALVMMLISAKSMPKHAGEPRRYFGFMVLAGVTSGGAVTLLVSALSKAPVAVVTPVASLNPIFTLTMAHLFLQRLERVTLRVVLGTAMALSGVLMVILGSTLL
ncbi:MAG: DMT family transporter [SAR202 cluster bacterium]|nr:DMT family transporter [SAR202 cluster bacterium]